MSENSDRENLEPRAVRITRRVDLLFWRTCGLNAIGLLAAWLLLRPEVRFDNPLAFFALVFAIWLLDWILKPILIVCTLPFIVLTFGVGMVFINAVVILAAAGLVPGIGFGGGWNGFFNAVIASFFVSVLSWGVALAESERVVRRSMGGDKSAEDKDDTDDKNGKSGKSGGSDVIDV